MSRPPSNPGLAAVLDLAMYPARTVRAQVIPHAAGEVLEVGAGTGANFPYYSERARSLTACEPDPHMRRRAENRIRAVSCPVRLDHGSAEALPYASGRFDTVVFAFTLCTVPDPQTALAEAFRVLRTGGTLVFAEHVAHPHPLGRRLQGALNRPWSFIAGGCRLNRDSVSYIREAGFGAVEQRSHGLQKWTLAPIVSGQAKKLTRPPRP